MISPVHSRTHNRISVVVGGATTVTVSTVTPEPVTPEPVTPEPVTPEPVTPEPVTPEPVTPDGAPEPTPEPDTLLISPPTWPQRV